MVEVATALLRMAGALYVIGGVAAGFRASNPAPAKSGDGVLAGSAAVALDGNRQSWRIVSALMFMAVGAAMVWGRDATVPLLGALLVQQGFYIIRQTMAARSVARRQQAQAHAPSINTKIMFAVTSVLTGYAAWLDFMGLLG